MVGEIKGTKLVIPPIDLDGETHESSTKKMDLFMGSGTWSVVGTYKGRQVKFQVTAGFTK
jgi:hypothetical protein